MVYIRVTPVTTEAWSDSIVGKRTDSANVEILRSIFKSVRLLTRSLGDEISTTEMAVWACNVAASMVNCILDAVPESEFRKALDLFYQKAFRQVRKSAAVESKW